MNNGVTTAQENRAPREQRQDRLERRGWVQPQVNITETQDGYILEAEMPGVGKDSLEVLLEGNELTIVGRRSVEVGEAQLLYRESAERPYRRTFELTTVIDTWRINSRMDYGIVYLALPKSERVKRRNISFHL